MIALQLLLLFSSPSADPADFFVPPQLDRFAHREMDDNLRTQAIDKVWESFEKEQKIYRANREELKRAFFFGMSDINLSGDQLNATLVEYERQLLEYQSKCFTFRVDMLDHVLDIKWAEYLNQLEEDATHQTEREDKIIAQLEEELQEFLDELIPSLPVAQQAPLKVYVRQFRNDLLEHYREYRSFDLHSHPMLRDQYATEAQLLKVAQLANRHSTGVWYEFLEMRESLRSALKADDWVAVTEPLDNLAKQLMKLSLENF